VSAQEEPEALPLPKPIEWPKRATDPRPPANAKAKGSRRASGGAGARAVRPRKQPKRESGKPE